MKLLFAICMSALLVGCSSSQVAHDYQPSFDFSQAMTVDVEQMSVQTLGLDGERIGKALNDGSRARGWQLGPEGDYQFQFSVEALPEKDSGMRVGIGLGSWSRSGISLGTSVSLPVGKKQTPHVLRVVLIDRQSEQTLWYGEEQWTVAVDATPAQREDAIRLIVAKLFQTIPK